MSLNKVNNGHEWSKFWLFDDENRCYSTVFVQELSIKISIKMFRKNQFDFIKVSNARI